MWGWVSVLGVRDAVSVLAVWAVVAFGAPGWAIGGVLVGL